MYSLNKVLKNIVRNPVSILKLLFIILISSFCLSIQLSAQQTYQLVWSDEFDSNAIDTTKWSFQIGDGTSYNLPPGWGNGELEWYLAENATVENGFLSITAKEEQIMEYDYTSARIRTKDKGDWTYGRFEMSAKLPLGQGLWPAFWMYPTEEFYGGWAASGELDIMELIGSAPDSVFGTIHYGGSFPANIFTSEYFVLPAGQTFADTFHVFAVEWEYGVISWYVDDFLYATQTDWYSSGGPFPAPFDRDFHILLNVAVGGSLPGTPDSTTIFPQTMIVDYVRVYKVADNTPPNITITNPPNGATIPSGSDIHITVDASDTTGNIIKVLFFQGDAQLGEDTESPYEYTVHNVSAGCYDISVKAFDNYGAAASDTVSIIVDSCVQAPYLMVPAEIPGVIEAENYDIGGQGVAYNDSDPGINNGNALGNEYRVDEGIDLLYNTDNWFGYYVGWIENGEWLEYQVNVQSSGIYKVDLRIASESNGGSLYIEFDGVDKTGPITFDSTGGWQDWETVRTKNISLNAGVQTIRVVMTDSAFNLNHIEFQIDTIVVVDSLVIFDDFEDGDISDWSFFPGNSAGGGGMVLDDRPAEGTYYLSTDWSGTGSNSFFYGGFYKNLDNSAQIDLPVNPWINIYLYNESITSVNEYAFEVTIREDTDGNGWTSGQEDSKRLDTYFSTSDFNDRWILVSAPVDSFMDIGTGGNGFFDGKLDELVIVISQVVGDNPSDVNVDIDFIAFSQGGPLITGLNVLHDQIKHPDKYELDFAYPNPFNPSTSITYYLPKESHVQIEVFNTLGQKVKTLVRKMQSAGKYSVIFDARDLASGVYIYRLKAGSFVETKKMVLMK
jgi:beta-glucanase (GH16 family)